VDPPRGFWTIDQAAMDFSTEDDLVVHEVVASDARHDEGHDLASVLLTRDSSFVEMPRVGDRFTMEFPVPETDPDRPERTVFARTSGYYTIHTDRSGARQASTLDSLWIEPDFGVDLSFRTFSDWQAGGALAAPGVIEVPGLRVR
jgi:hypothetical protein